MEEATDALYDELPIGLITARADARIVRTNQTLLAWTGWSIEQLLQRSWTEILLAPASRDFVHQHVLPTLMRESVVHQLACDIRCLGGRRMPVLIDIRLLRDRQGQTCGQRLAIVEAIDRQHHERQLMEAKHRAEDTAEALRELTAELERRVEERTADLSAANRELDQYAHAISHDLRAPLRVIHGFSTLLRKDLGSEPPRVLGEYLDHIDNARQAMAALIEGLLQLSRYGREDLYREDVDVSAMAERICNELNGLEPTPRVVWQVDGDLRAHADPRMLEAVLRNLLGNAWKFTAHCAQPRVHVHRPTEPGTARDWICVSDNGAGFDMNHAEQLFRPFQRLHRSDEFPGTGIGLTTVQRIVERHGGHIEASGSVGGGAQFRFHLPRP